MIGAITGAAKRGRKRRVSIGAPGVKARLGQWREAERHRFILLAPLLMIAGIACYLSLKTEPPLLAGPGAAGSALLVWILAGRAGREGLRLAGRALFFLALGFALIAVRAAGVQGPQIGHETPPVTIEGRLLAVESLPAGQRYLIAPSRIGGFRAEDVPKRVRVSWRGRPSAAAPGDMVAVRAVLSPPPGPAMPQGYDYGRQLFFEQIGGVGFAYGGARVTKEAGGLALAARLERLREKVADRVQAGAGGDAGALAAALVTGKRERVPEAVVERLRDTGLAHLLAISGLHMGLVCGFLFGAVRLGLAFSERAALTWPIKKIAAAAAMAGGAFYLALSGAPVSAQRAFVMAAVAFGAILADRQAVSLRNVAFAAILILLLRPEAAASAGFQMSFTAVTALVAAFSYWEARRRHDALERVSRPGRAVRFLGGLFATSLLAGLATGPFAIYHFGRAATYGLLANMLVMPAVTLLVMPVAVAGLVVMPLGLDGPFFAVMGEGLRFVLWVTGKVETLPGAVQLIAKPPTTAWLFTVAAILSLSLLAAPWRLAGLLALPLAAALTAAAPMPDVFIGREARQVGIRTMTPEGERLALLSRRRDRFSAEVWMTRLGIAPIIAAQPKFGECGEALCSARLPDGRLVSVASTPEAAAGACREAAIVVYTGYAPHALAGCEATLFTAADVGRTGPVTLTGVRIDSVGTHRGCRPWAAC